MQHFFGKTVLGGLLAVFGYVSQPDVLAVLPKKPAAIIAGVGAIMSIVGARDAIAKNGRGK